MTYAVEDRRAKLLNQNIRVKVSKEMLAEVDKRVKLSGSTGRAGYVRKLLEKRFERFPAPLEGWTDQDRPRKIAGHFFIIPHSDYPKFMKACTKRNLNYDLIGDIPGPDGTGGNIVEMKVTDYLNIVYDD